MDNRNVFILKNPVGNLSICLRDSGESCKVLVLVTAGTLTCSANGSDRTVDNRCIVLMPSASCVSSLATGPDFKGYVVCFSREFFDSLHLNVNRQLLWKNLGTLLVKEINKKQADVYKVYIETMIDSVSDSSNGYGEESSWLLAKALSYKVLQSFAEDWREQKADSAYERKDQIVRDFMTLIHEHGIKHRDLDFYASEMCLSPKYLSHVVSKVTGKKALAWIEDFTISRACYMLKSTDKSINQISDALNFSAPSDFCRYFKKRTGTSPKQYRLHSDEYKVPDEF